MHLCLVRKIVSNFILQSLKISELRHFCRQKSVSAAQRQSLLIRNYFAVSVPAMFFPIRSETHLIL